MRPEGSNAAGNLSALHQDTKTLNDSVPQVNEIKDKRKKKGGGMKYSHDEKVVNLY